MTHSDYQAAEVAWYRQNGLHHDRVATDSEGKPYVIGDDGWNRRHPKRQEWVDLAMKGWIIRSTYSTPATEKGA